MAGYCSDRRLLRAAARRLAVALIDDPNVTHVSTGWKHVDGAQTGQLAIKVHVIEKGAGVGNTRQLPASWTANDRRFAIDIVEIGEPPSLSRFAGGDQVLAFDNDLGINGLAFTKSGRSYLLTNAHVVCDAANGCQTGPVSAYNGSVAASVRLGDVAYLSALSPTATVREDAAAVAVDNPQLVDPYRISYDGSVVSREGVIQPQWGPYWFASAGELFTCDDAEPVDGPANVEIDGIRLTYQSFWQLRMTQGMVRKGLSGSLLCRRVGGDTIACGLLFGQTGNGAYAWVFQFSPLFLNVRNNLP